MHHTSARRKIVFLERTTPLSCCEIRGRGAVIVELRPKAKPDVWAVVTASLIAGMAFWVLCAFLLHWAKVSYSPHVYYKHVTLSMLGFPAVFGRLLLAALLFTFAYPLIGLAVSAICGVLAKEIARLYEFKPRGRLHPNLFLLFTSSWPVTMWTIPLLVFAWGIGIVCRFFWK